MNKTILVVDDDASVREAMDKVLRGAGYQPVLASGGLEAILRLQTHSIDLVLLDIGLPNQNGWETCKHFAGEHSHLPIIVITGQSGQFNSALAAGAAALMEKPLDAHLLLRTIQQLLGETTDSAPVRPKKKLYHVAA